MFHSISFLACVSGPLVEGTSVIILGSVADMSKAEYSGMISRLRPTMMLGVPAVYAALTRLKITPEARAEFPFRVCASGGAPLPVEVIKRFQELYGKPLIEGYGLSEASPGVAVNPLDWQKPGTIGKPLPGIELMVADEEGNELPVNTPGELCVKGDNVMKGYWESPEETAKVIRNGWLRSGDVATKDEDGFYTIVDRIKDLIIVKGMNLYPREIEELLYRYDGVHSAAVVGVPDGEGSEIPVAFIKPEEGAELSERRLKSYISDNVALFKVPRRIVFIDEIPMTGSGKVFKKALKEKATELFK
jgi:long-chain acyl-CoA synthetase